MALTISSIVLQNDWINYKNKSNITTYPMCAILEEEIIAPVRELEMKQSDNECEDSDEYYSSITYKYT